MTSRRLQFWRRSGFSLIELMVVIAVVSVLAAVLLNRVLWYQEQAEKVAMQQVVGILRSALHLQVASLQAKGKVGELTALLEQNPMNWLAQQPANYAGEFSASMSGHVEAGSWFFDLSSKELIYLVRNDAHFRSTSGQDNQVRFQVRLVKPDKGKIIDSSNFVEGVVLSPVTHHTWF